MEKHKTIEEFAKALSSDQKEQFHLLRDLIVNNNPGLVEHIKWNSPSYILNGNDRLTFSARPGLPIALVLHMGASRPEEKGGAPIMKDPSGLIEWKSDIRGVISFVDTNDIESKRPQIIQIISRWLKINV